MEHNDPKHIYIFQDPNRPSDLVQAIRKILLEKLLALPTKPGTEGQ